jgi:hypothetical protein
MFNRFKKEKVFKVPDVRRANEHAGVPAAVIRHYHVMRDAMKRDDVKTVANRQIRLLRGGAEIPLTLSQCDDMLEKYSDDS